LDSGPTPGAAFAIGKAQHKEICMYLLLRLGLLFSLLFPTSLLAAGLPDIAGDTWLNTAPLQRQDLAGKVVLVEFWTYGCHNCRAVEPYVKQWYRSYADQGLVVIAIHSPEFAHERQRDNVRQYLSQHQMTYPVLMDNDFRNWRRFANRYWPTLYLADRSGQLRYRKIGEGDYDRTEQWIKRLLAEQASP
jgi:thiol-disulfide isomerase/thioredoxin